MTREEAIKILKDIREINGTNRGTYAVALAMGIDALQAEPVKRGKWTHEGIDYMTEQEAYDCQKVFCSECRQESKSYFKNYCPNCGAKMDKD